MAERERVLGERMTDCETHQPIAGNRLQAARGPPAVGGWARGARANAGGGQLCWWAGWRDRRPGSRGLGTSWFDGAVVR